MSLVHFENGFNGTYEAGGQTLHIGADGLMPYDMTYGALSGCLYSNFLKHASTYGITVRSTDVVIEGRKRKTVPATLEYVHITFKVDSDADMDDLRGCLQQATETCSMFQTIAAVADMEYDIEKI